MKTMLCAATLAATLGIAADALAGVGDPTGTTFGLSAINYGASFNFGADLVFQPSGDDAWTEDGQLAGTGTPVVKTFGTAAVINEIEFSETYQVWLPAAHPAIIAQNGLSGGDLPIPQWDNPAHLVELKVRDTAGTLDDGGGINRAFFDSGVIRWDAIKPLATTPSGVDAIPLFGNDRHPETNPVPFDGNGMSFFFYYELNGAPANPVGNGSAIPFGSVLQGDHPTKGASQQVFYIAYSDSQVDDDVTHDIGPGTFGVNSDTWRELAEGANLINLASTYLDYAIPEEEFDTVVFGFNYVMVAEGDGDSNGKVDGLDYLRWAANFGTTPVNVPLLDTDGGMNPIEAAPSSDGTSAGNNGSLDYLRFYGDYNQSGGPVDGLDYLKWAANFGFVGDGTGPPSAAVPEPSSLVLACFALAGMGLSVRRRRV